MRSRSLMVPHRFRFTDPDDVAKYGDGWHTYDEAQIVRLPARDLAVLEAELGVPLVVILEGFREDTVMGRLGATWLALRLAAPEVAGAFADYSPLVLLLNIEPGRAAEEDVAVPLDPTPSESSPTSPAAE